MNTQIVLFEEDSKRLSQACLRLQQEAYARAVFLLDKDGQLLASEGEIEGLDITSLASLTAGNIAATGGLAKLLGEKEFPVQVHEGDKESIHISLIGDRLILVILFDERSSLGLIRLKLKHVYQDILEIARDIFDKSKEELKSVFSEITDDDIDHFFGLD
ncbi:MAG: dynein regulation protein LC7 [Myxococcales bacterium]|nr:dynein regulation protein LC7 [Myxococcales bacterium]